MDEHKKATLKVYDTLYSVTKESLTTAFNMLLNYVEMFGRNVELEEFYLSKKAEFNTADLVTA